MKFHPTKPIIMCKGPRQREATDFLDQGYSIVRSPPSALAKWVLGPAGT